MPDSQLVSQTKSHRASLSISERARQISIDPACHQARERARQLANESDSQIVSLPAWQHVILPACQQASERARQGARQSAYLPDNKSSSQQARERTRQLAKRPDSQRVCLPTWQHVIEPACQQASYRARQLANEPDSQTVRLPAWLQVIDQTSQQASERARQPTSQQAWAVVLCATYDWSLTVSQTSTGFYVSAVHVFWKQSGKRRNCSERAISIFPTVFSTRLDHFLPFLSNLKLSSANFVSLDQS